MTDRGTRLGTRRRRILLALVLPVLALALVGGGLQVRGFLLPEPVSTTIDQAEVQDFVERAVEYARSHDKAEALAAFTGPAKEFRRGELYIFAYDFSGTVLAHGGDRSLVGKNLIDQVDANGVPVVQRLIEIASAGEGWAEYIWPNPVHRNALEPKTSFVKRVDQSWFIGAGAYGTAAELAPVRVQLKWYHQAQFAGYYVAQDQGFFAQRGIAVNAMPAEHPADRSPIESLVDGTADVAEASMSQAVQASTGGRRFVNVAQLFQRSDTALICRIGPGFVSVEDLRRARIAASADRLAPIRALIARLVPGGGSVTYLQQKPDIASLIDGSADCVWGSTFNEVFQAADAGLAFFLVRPEDYGVVNLEDGLYVDEARLADPTFRERLVGLLLGLQEGWAFARANPAATIQLVLAQPGRARPALGETRRVEGTADDPQSQARQLQVVLASLGDAPFGYLDLEPYRTVDGFGAPMLPPELSDRLWTHEVWNAAQAANGDGHLLSPVTEEYLVLLRKSLPYQLLMTIGVFAAATAGAVVAVRRRYRIWGMFVVGAVTALGGGVVRDLILGGIRYPIWLLRDPTDLITVGIAVLLIWAIANLASSTTVSLADRLASHADIVGFSIIGINGAIVAIIAHAGLYLAPFLAAISTAGGGILTDILVNREHEGFGGSIYEEAAILGSLVLIGGLVVADAREHQPAFVLAAVLGSLVLLLVFRSIVQRFGLRYPEIRKRRDHHDEAMTAVEPVEAGAV